jgi:hypothetical protein
MKIQFALLKTLVKTCGISLSSPRTLERLKLIIYFSYRGVIFSAASFHVRSLSHSITNYFERKSEAACKVHAPYVLSIYNIN